MEHHRFSTRSESRLRNVHPDLVKVTRLALTYSDVDFGITEGERTNEDQLHLVAEGASSTVNSRHVVVNNKCGYACAVDVVAYIGSSISWDMKFYKQIAKAFFRAAIESGVQIEWGGHWSKPVDGPHFQLTWKEYP